MIIAPVMPPTPPTPEPQPAVTRVRKVGFYTVCDICGLAVEWCKGHTLPEYGAGDGAESSLGQRIADVMVKARQ